MSDDVYPILPGLAWSVVRTPQWSTSQQKSKSGRRYAVGDRLYPTWKYELPYEVLRNYGSFNEQETLVGFVNRRRGALNDFLYRDPDDFLVTNQFAGVGTGGPQTLDLTRHFGDFVEPVIACDSLSVFLDGNPMPYGNDGNHFSTDAGFPNVSQLILNTGANPGGVITWSGTFYWRCSFLNDAIPFEQFVKGLWKASIEFESHQ